MTEAYIYDAVRTPRGKGKKDGSLHEITGLSLATQVLEALRDRNGLDTSKVDDVILGCVSPVGEQGADIARTAVLSAGWAQSVAGVQINRFCASGLEAVNMAAAQAVEHYEITRYGTLKRWANVLGLKDAAKLLDETLQEESQTDEDLTTIADAAINADAMAKAA